MNKIRSTYEPADMRVTGFGGTSVFPKGRRNLNYRRFEDNGRKITIDANFN